MSFIINPYQFGPPVVPPAFITYIGDTLWANNNSSLTNVPIGTPDDNRLIFAILAEISTGGRTDGLLIDGIEARLVTDLIAAAVHPCIFVARVPEGATATIQRKRGNNINNPAPTNVDSRIAIYTANAADYPLVSQFDLDEGDNTDPINLSVTPPSLGNVITIGMVQNGNDGTLTGVDSVDYDGDVNSNEWTLIGNSTEIEGVQSISHSLFGPGDGDSPGAVAAAFALEGPAAFVKDNRLKSIGFSRGGNGVTSLSEFSLPPEDPDRTIFAVFSGATGTGTLSSVTIGGVSASLVVRSDNTVAQSSIWVAKVPTGKTANVVVDLSNNGKLCEMFSAYTSDSAATIVANAVTDTDTSIVSPHNISLSVTPTGTAELLAVCATNNVTSISVTGVETEVSNGEFNEPSSGEFASVGFSSGVSGQQDVDFTVTSGVQSTGCAAALVMS